MQTLRNSYHNTSMRLRTALSWDQIEHRAYHGDKVARALKARIRRKLCGIKGCTCGIVR